MPSYEQEIEERYEQDRAEWKAIESEPARPNESPQVQRSGDGSTT
jgi:hypothetical protein